MMSMKMDYMFSGETEDEVQQRGGIHKEEGCYRRKLDAVDRTKIRNEIMGHTSPLQTQPDDQLHNIVNGRVADSEVNVDETLEVGKTMSADQCCDLETMVSRLECTRVHFVQVSVSVSRPDGSGLGLGLET